MIDNNLNPTWTKHFTVKYRFNRDSDLRFEVWNYNTPTSKDLIGEVRVKLSEIMMANNQEIIKDLVMPENPGVSRGKLRVFADSVTATEDIVKF